VPSSNFILPILLAAGVASAQPAKKAVPPLHAESASTFNFRTGPDGQQTAEIRNVTYEVSGTNIPGRPAEERLLMRNTTRSSQVLGDIGMDSTVTLEAWPIGQDPRQKPLYTLSVPGGDGHAVDNALFVVQRSLDEDPWWSAYKLGSGQHLFDSYVPIVSFSILRETLTTRYVALDAPRDDTKDARLKQPNVVAVLTYASEDRVIREALITCDDPAKAVLLRSFADATRTIALLEDQSQPTRTLRLYFSMNYPSPAQAAEIRIPVRNDDLDLAHAQLPPRLHVAAWKR